MAKTSANAIQRDLLAWYDASARDLPWRGMGREVGRGVGRGVGGAPYRVLVSEFMLQQTQVATVIPYFQRWMAALPTLEALAAADEQVVLRLWQGLGYYARARNLHKAAKAIVAEHGGQVPRTAEALRALPGIGRYTAGAIASIAWDQPVPILDGNVVRVLCRIHRIESDPRAPATQKRLWALAAALVPANRAGDFNSALMELGAVVCTPRSPKCLLCPVRAQCAAQKAGVQEQIPPARPAKATPLVERDVYRITDAAGRYLIEQRPLTGRWAGLWQFITGQPGFAPPLVVAGVREVGQVKHALTHRRYIFRVLSATAADRDAPAGLRWVSRKELDSYPLPKPHVRVLGL